MKTEIDASNKSKGTDRIQINNILTGMSIGVLTVVLSLSTTTNHNAAILQLALSIPILVTSSLTYAKVVYRDSCEHNIWNAVGWLTHSVGYICILNAIYLLLEDNTNTTISWVFLAVVFACFVVYTIVDISIDRKRLKEKSLKLFFYTILVLFGSIIPILVK